MRIIFNSCSFPLAAAKLLARHGGHVKLSSAQSAIAKAAGYKDWYDLSNSTHPAKAVRSIDFACARTIILTIADNLNCSLGDVQYALTKSRLLSLNLEENLRLRAMIWRKNLFGEPARGKAGTLVSVKALRGKELGYLKLNNDGYCQVLYDSGFGLCASSEVVVPRTTAEDFAPSVLWLPYGYWVVGDGSTILFSRDYHPLWRIKDGLVTPTDPWDWISDIQQERFFRELAGSDAWSHGPARALALKFLAEKRIFEAPRLLNAMPFLFEQGITNVKGAVKRLSVQRQTFAA